MNHIIITKQISLSKFLVSNIETGDNYVLEFYPGLVEFNINNAMEAIKNSKRVNDSNYYLTQYNFKSTTKIYLRKYNNLSEISHLFPSTGKSISETYFEYSKKIFPERQQWITGLINGTSEADIVIFRDKDIVIGPDPKWPIPKKMYNFYYLAMFSDLNLRSIRDLTGNHIPVLKKLKKIIIRELKKDLKNQFDEDLNLSELALFFHYPPQYWQLHLHITHTNSFRHCNNHFLDTIISNLELDPNYYQKVILSFVE